MSDSALSLNTYINQHAYLLLQADGSKREYRVPIVITDAKRAYGRLRFCVRVTTATYGNPKDPEWVNAERVALRAEKEKDHV